MVKENSYITIQAFMINDLKLKGNDLLIFAIIYGFSQDGESDYKGSRQYLANWCNSTLRGIDKSLNHLIELDLIEKCKVENKVLYRTKFSMGENKVLSDREQSSPNNIDNKLDNKLDNKKEILKEKKFKKPTVEEVDTYALEKGYELDSEYFVDFYESKGWLVGKTPMKDWKAAVRNWIRQKSKYQKNETYGEMLDRWGKELEEEERKKDDKGRSN